MFLLFDLASSNDANTAYIDPTSVKCLATADNSETTFVHTTVGLFHVKGNVVAIADRLQIDY